MRGRGARRGVVLVALIGLAVALAVAVGEAPDPDVGAWLGEQGLETREAELAGRRVRFVVTGSEGPPVLLIHGLASSIYTWKVLLPELSRRHRVAALDLPGFGASEQPPDLAFADLEASGRALLDALGWGRASLVGNSLGGAVAASLAAHHPERVERLVLIDAAGFQPRPEDAPALLRLAASPLGELLAALPVRRPLMRLALRQVFYDDTLVTDERVEEYLAPQLRPGALPALRSLLAARLGELTGLRASLAAIRAPTLIVWGEEDEWIPPSHAELFRNAIHGAEVERLPACGHMPQEECPALLLERIGPFLDAEPPPGTAAEPRP